ncbi:unnamed protein product [Rotaria sp. Silwood1]|nr:unnamed protein product [Rotaria sp. Silwood1]CAF1470998.1 unnamed protein product [Rotaria sp. Silwood1]CAF3549813.1 unnamed protein product [Rotaria sp. Silwood1]CAF3668875.1 unnamed protein product [Rotaria sp. Silwood1]CAF4596883.1 unnamed protein product [Rotaria sp. Silwood1]
MAVAQSEASPDNDLIALTSDSSGQIMSISSTEQATNLFHQLIDSFKRTSSSGNVSIEMNRSKQAEDQDSHVEKGETGLHRNLKNRHLQMIAIGGSIGTGLFVASGTALATGGPAAVVLDFAIIGFMLFNVCMALGELAVTFPVSGSFAVYGSRFLDPAWGFAMGWNYALSSLITMPLELTAAGIVIDYWKTHVNLAVWITIFLIALLIINLFGVRGYGEVEFCVSIIKVIGIIGFIILGIVLVFRVGPNHVYFGFKYWHDPARGINLFIMNVFLGFRGMITYVMVRLLTTELFPTNVRTTALGCCSTVGHLGALVRLSFKHPIVLYEMVSFIAASIALLFRETSNRALPPIVQEAARMDLAFEILCRSTLNTEFGEDDEPASQELAENKGDANDMKMESMIEIDKKETSMQ